MLVALHPYYLQIQDGITKLIMLTLITGSSFGGMWGAATKKVNGRIPKAAYYDWRLKMCLALWGVTLLLLVLLYLTGFLIPR